MAAGTDTPQPNNNNSPTTTTTSTTTTTTSPPPPPPAPPHHHHDNNNNNTTTITNTTTTTETDSSPLSNERSPLPSITFTFPVIVITNPSDSETQQHEPLPAEYLRNLFALLFRAMPFAAAGQFEPMPSGPPKKHATQSAIDKLRVREVTSLPQEERRCNICMQDFVLPHVGPRSPYVEDVKDEDDFSNVIADVESTLIDQGESSGQENVGPKDEEGEVPLEMLCGHVFGSKCLKEWLYQSPTCPLCRIEVESYTDDPVPTATEQGDPDEMEMDPPSAEGPTQTQTQTQTHHPNLAVHVIFTAPSPPPSQSPQTNASVNPPSPISRPPSSHSIRHHPYARPNPPSPPSLADRPDLFCAQRTSGLCTHDLTDENLLRLECGHAFHVDCLEGSMLIDGYPLTQRERRCPRCRRWMNVLN